jgi:mono/diheme cytochrome c family protein
MTALRMPPVPRPSASKALYLALVVTAVASALAAGCGGAPKSASEKSASETTGSSLAGGTASAATPAAATPALPESAAIPAPVGPATPSGEPGALVFARRCALCHGADGHGDGVASKGLNPKPRNFHDQAYMSTRTDAQLLDVIHKGKGVMPRWQGQLSEAEMKAVLAHIRSLGTKP